MKKVRLYIQTLFILISAVIKALPGLLKSFIELCGKIVCSIPSFILQKIKDLFSGDPKEIMDLAIEKAKEKIETVKNC